MATIRKKGEYQWHVQVRRKGYPQQTRTFNTKAEAEAWAKMLESEMARGVWISRGEAERTTLHEALDRYERDITGEKRGAVQERSTLARLREHKLARCSMASIRSQDIAGLRDEWVAERLAPGTIARRLALLSHVFTVARQEWGMESLLNPVQLVRKPPVQNARTRRVIDIPAGDDDSPRQQMTVGELGRIIAASGSTRLASVITLAVETAMRRGELAELRWDDIDLARRVAHLRKTKNGDARDVPLSPAAVALLERIPRHQQDPRVFRMRADSISQAFGRAVERARQQYEAECAGAGRKPDQNYLVDLRFHDLRHEATSRLAEKLQMHELARVTGHRDTRMLLRYYHPRAEDLAQKLG